MKPALTRPDDKPAPTTSWWISLDRPAFAAAVAREFPRMRTSKDADNRKGQALDMLPNRGRK